MSARCDEIALYTGNDDNIVNDLLTLYRFDIAGNIVRNGFGAVTALATADMAMVGVVSVIPSDEVVQVMLEVGISMLGPLEMAEPHEVDLWLICLGVTVRSTHRLLTFWLDAELIDIIGEERLSSSELFKWKHYEVEIILITVRWYLHYSLSYRDLAEIMSERGLDIAL